jgi:hypothetical protein
LLEDDEKQVDNTHFNNGHCPGSAHGSGGSAGGSTISDFR